MMTYVAIALYVLGVFHSAMFIFELKRLGRVDFDDGVCFFFAALFWPVAEIFSLLSMAIKKIAR